MAKQKFTSTKSVLLLASIMAVSCAKNIPGGNKEQGSAISFDNPSAETRAAITGTEFPKESFLVWGGTIENGKGQYNNLFNNDEIKYSEKRGWYYEKPLMFWEKGKTYDFYGIYPATVKDKATIIKEGDAIHVEVQNFEINTTGEHAIDFMTAIDNKEYKKTDNTPPGAIKFNFNHTLSRVSFVLKNSTKGDVSFIAAGLESMGYKGNYKSASQGGNWIITDRSTTTVMNSGTVFHNIPAAFTNKTEQTVGTGKELDLFGEMLLFPQNHKTNSGQKGILCIEYKSGKETTAKKVELQRDWDAGKSYRYILEVKEDIPSTPKLEVTVTISDWEGNIINSDIIW